MTLSLDRIQNIAKDTRFLPATVEKVMRLSEILNEIKNHPFLSDRLVLKGGTAIHLFHLNGQRLSVDIDLNYIGQVDREKMAGERPVVQDTLQKLCSSLGYKIQRRPTEHAGGKWRLNYQGHHGQPQILEVDINFLYRLSIWEPTLKTIQVKKWGIDCEFSIVSNLELWAGKMAATITRSEPRDLYDISLIPEKILQDKLFRSTVILFGSAFRHDFRKIKLIDWESSLEKQFRERLFPVLRSDEKLNPKLVVDKARKAIAPFLDFKKDEMAYLNFLIDEGDYRPNLLFSDGSLIEKLIEHPVVLWKALNVREHQEKV